MTFGKSGTTRRRRRRTRLTGVTRKAADFVCASKKRVVFLRLRNAKGLLHLFEDKMATLGDKIHEQQQ